MQAVLVLNADLGPLHRVTIRHAIRMICRKVAEIHEADPDGHIGIFPLPRSVRLIHYIVTKWRYTTGPAWSRPGVMGRDSQRCGYCHGKASTIDHIVPRSQGGKNLWTNTVAACGPCNQRKGDRTPDQASMRLRTSPYAPTWASLSSR